MRTGKLGGVVQKVRDSRIRAGESEREVLDLRLDMERRPGRSVPLGYQVLIPANR